MPAILKNNTFSTLATGIAASETSLVVVDGSQFPAVTGDEYFYATLVSQTGTIEIIKVTTRVGNTMVVVRAEDGSIASSFQVGTLVEMRVNASSVIEYRDLISAREYNVVGDGVTDDGQNFELFVLGAENAAFGTVPPAVYRLGNSVVNDASNSRIVSAPGAVFERETGIVNMFTLVRPQHVDLEGLTIDGRYSTLGTDGTAFRLTDPVDVTLDRFTTRNWGGTAGGGLGLSAINSVNPAVDKLRITRSNFEGAVAPRSNGVNITNGRYCTISDSHVYNTTSYGLGFQPGTQHSILSSSTAQRNGGSFVISGSSGNARNNVLGLLASNDSDSAVTVLNSNNNVIMGVSAHVNTQPDVFANGQAYGLHLSTASDENLALGILASGTIMDYPVRIRGDRNVVSIADYSDAAKTVTFNDGAIENYVEILHIGEKATSIATLIADSNVPNVYKGPGANVIDSPLTREYFGSIRNNFKWSLAGYGTSYAHFSTTGFAFEGNNGISVLGLGAGNNGEAGLSVSTTATGGVGSLLYGNTASPFWRFTVGGTQRIVLDAARLGPVTSGGMNLGSTAIPFNQLWVNSIDTTSLKTDGIILDVADGGETSILASTPTVSGVGALAYVNTVGAPYWRFNVDSAQRLRIDTTKVAPITANGMSLGNSTLPFNQVWANYVNTNTLDVNGTIDTTGFVEVGILGTGDRTSAVDFHSSGTPGAINYSARILRQTGVNGAFDTYQTGTGNIVWWINNVAKMTIEGATGKLYLSGSAARGFSGWVVTSSNDSIASALRAPGYIEWQTDVGPIGTNYFLSDVRKKDNVAPSVQSSADLINQIDFIQFDWKPESGNTGHVDVGVSAQQLQSIDTRLVHELSDGGLMVNEPALVAHMAKALQEALAKITALEARITALEA